MGETLMKGLALRGHQVTMVSVGKLKSSMPNYTEVHVDNLGSIVARSLVYLQRAYKTNYFQRVYEILNVSSTESELLLNHPAYKKLLASNQTFDLVILDYMGNFFHVGICQHYQASCVLVTALGNNGISILAGVFQPWSYVPAFSVTFSSQMTLLQRAFNAVATIYHEYIGYNYVAYSNRKLYEKYFPNASDFDLAMKNFSLFLVNSHVAVETPRYMLPIMKQIGGLHVAEPQKLPDDLQEFLDSATEGAILFSIGSNLRSKELPPDIVQSFINVFSKIPQKIIWKWEDDILPVQLSNVKFCKWLPQNDVLAHPNLKIFITHGGMMSFIEAVIRAVPVIGIPFFGDQFNNVATIFQYGYGIRILIDEISEENVLHAVTEILKNPRYAESIKRGSNIMRDEPMKPLDSAIYWIEHVLRQNGGRHLMSSFVDLPMYQVLMIDVAALFIIIVIVIKICIVYVKNLLVSFVKKNFKKKAA